MSDRRRIAYSKIHRSISSTTNINVEYFVCTWFIILCMSNIDMKNKHIVNEEMENIQNNYQKFLHHSYSHSLYFHRYLQTFNHWKFHIWNDINYTNICTMVCRLSIHVVYRKIFNFQTRIPQPNHINKSSHISIRFTLPSEFEERREMNYARRNFSDDFIKILLKW